MRIVAGDGKPAALLNITRQIGGNTVAIADSVAQIAAGRSARRCRAGVDLKPVYDQASLVRDAVKSVRDAMLDRRRARRDRAVRVPAPRAHHGDQRVVDSAHDGDHRVRDVARGADVQPHDARRDGHRDRHRDRRRRRDHREHRAARRLLHARSRRSRSARPCRS